jgi:hypothetical protein
MATIVINSGIASSAAFFVTRSDLFVAVGVSSASASEVGLAFGTTSAGPFLPLRMPDGTGRRFLAVLSGDAAGWAIAKVPTPWVTVTQTPATVSPRSVTLLTVY